MRGPEGLSTGAVRLAFGDGNFNLEFTEWQSCLASEPRGPLCLCLSGIVRVIASVPCLLCNYFF